MAYEKPIVYLNNVFRKAKEGDDGTEYGIGTGSIKHPINNNSIAATILTIGDIGSISSLHGGNLVFDTTRNSYRIIDTLSIAPLPASRQWFGIAWNGNIFCCLGSSSSKCAISSDGIIWTEEDLPSTASWYSVAWNGSVFCAIASYTDKCATSPDGVNWTERTLPASRQWYDIAWNGSVFCAVAISTDKCATSPDGIVWTERTMSASLSWTGIGWNGSIFCAVATGTNQAATSPDGITWTARTLPASRNWQNVNYSGAVFCAVATATDKCATSPDGVTWTERTLPASRDWVGIGWNGSLFLATALSTDKCATSSDGINWEEQTLPATGTTYDVGVINGLFILPRYNSTSIYITIDGVSYPSAIVYVFERIQNEDINGSFTIRAGLICAHAAESAPVDYAADNHLVPLHQGTENTAYYLRAHLPNLIEDGGFESGAFSPNWTAESAAWVIESTTELEGSYSASYDLTSSKYLRQSSTGTLKKGLTYRLVYKAKSVTADPTSGVLTVNLFQTGTGTALDSDVTGTTPAITTTSTWFAIDFTPDFTTDDWYLNIAGDSTKANGATEIMVDEFYLYEKPKVNTFILGRHNLVGKSGMTIRSYKMSPLRSTVGADDYTEIKASFSIDTADTYSTSVTESYDPVYEFYVPASSGFTPEMGEVYLGDGWTLPTFLRGPFDPWRTNADGLREVSLRIERIPPGLRTTTIERLFEKLRAGESVWFKWDTDQPLLMHSPRAGREAPFSPYTANLDLTLEEVL